MFNVGQVGSLASEEERTKLEELSKAAIPLSESKPAKFPLAGEHKLLYSAAPGVSSGRIFGNVVGKVTQFFEDDEIFYNRVSFGPLRIALKAKREIKDDSTIQVSFLETKVSLFGKTLAQKNAGGGKYCLWQNQSSGVTYIWVPNFYCFCLSAGGYWKVKFVGTVKDQQGKEKLIRIMETPSLFVIEQPLNWNMIYNYLYL